MTLIIEPAPVHRSSEYLIALLPAVWSKGDSWYTRPLRLQEALEPQLRMKPFAAWNPVQKVQSKPQPSQPSYSLHPALHLIFSILLLLLLTEVCPAFTRQILATWSSLSSWGNHMHDLGKKVCGQQLHGQGLACLVSSRSNKMAKQSYDGRGQKGIDGGDKWVVRSWNARGEFWSRLLWWP